MNVFVLCTGRCGSHTFIEACRHISNYSAGHETRSRFTGNERLNYAANHIEADNRLSWFLGRLDRIYGDEAFYVHLTRDRQRNAASMSRYMHMGILKAYTDGILMRSSYRNDPMEFSLDLYDTINMNIESFLKDKSRKMEFTLENAKQDFKVFWEKIGAEGDLDAALGEWEITYNKSKVDILENVNQAFRKLRQKFKRPIEKDFPSL
ncbi:MAG: hypothetical protein R3297_01435 [Desulfobulbales bacterium]|nr:hypothetical protein [Desulfobulbales bacterium]